MNADLQRILTEYDDRSPGEIMRDTYVQLEWIRYSKRRKPGWTARFYHSLFDRWPEAWMKALTPVPATALVEKLVRRRDRLFLKGVRERERNARATLRGGVAEAAGQNGHAGGDVEVEGGFDLADMAGGGYYAGDRPAAVRRQGARRGG
jgi:hypothetical protein